MRCPNCKRFTSLETMEPEVDDIQVDDGIITASVRIVCVCQDCGDEMKEATLEIEDEIPTEITEDHNGDNHTLTVEAGDVEQIEEGGGRYAKSYFGAKITYRVLCSCSPDSPIYESEMEDSIAASDMEELV